MHPFNPKSRSPRINRRSHFKKETQKVTGMVQPRCRRGCFHHIRKWSSVCSEQRDLIFCSNACVWNHLSGGALCSNPHTPATHIHPLPRPGHLPDRPVRAGPHLPKVSVPLRHFPFGFVDILAVVTGSDSLWHCGNWEIVPKIRWFDLFRASRLYTPIVPDPTYARKLSGCAVRLRVSRSGRTHRSPRTTQELPRVTIKGEQR